jgi:hypothetical protein
MYKSLQEILEKLEKENLEKLENNRERDIENIEKNKAYTQHVKFLRNLYESISIIPSSSSSSAGGSLNKELFLTQKNQVVTNTFKYRQPSEFDRTNNLIYFSTAITTYGDPFYITSNNAEGNFLEFLTTGYDVPISFQVPYYKESTSKMYYMTSSGIVETTILKDDFTSSPSNIVSPYFVDQQWPSTGIFSILFVEGDLMYCVQSLENGVNPHEWLIINKSTGNIVSRINATYVGNQEFQAPRGYFDTVTKKYYFIHWVNEGTYWDPTQGTFFAGATEGRGTYSYRVFDYNTMYETTYSTLGESVEKEYYLGKVRRIISETIWELYANIDTTFALLKIDITTGEVLNTLVSDIEFPVNISPFYGFLLSNPIILSTENGETADIKVIMNRTDYRQLKLEFLRVP